MTTNEKNQIDQFCLEMLRRGQQSGPYDEDFEELESRVGALTSEKEVYFVATFEYIRDWPFERRLGDGE